MATYWENSCSFGLRYVSWYKYLIVSLVFSHLGFWSGNLFLIAPFPDLCLLVPFYTCHENAFHTLQTTKKCTWVEITETVCVTLFILLYIFISSLLHTFFFFSSRSVWFKYCTTFLTFFPCNTSFMVHMKILFTCINKNKDMNQLQS